MRRKGKMIRDCNKGMEQLLGDLEIEWNREMW